MNILIKNANVFDGKNESLKMGSNIVIKDDKVREIFSGDICEENFDKIYDAAGYTVIPGLTDNHVHISFTSPLMVNSTYRLDEMVLRSARYAAEMLGRGFTTIRDAGGVTVGLKNCIDNGMLDGPRIFPSNGGIVQTCGHAASSYFSDFDPERGDTNLTNRYGALVFADGRDEMLKKVRQQLFLGASQIKLMAGGGMASFFDPLPTVQFTLDELKAAVEAASDYGTYVMAHLYIPQSINRALDAGIMSYEHATLMDEGNAKRIQEKGAWICMCPQFGDNGGEKVQRSRPMPTLLGTPVKKYKPTMDIMTRGLLNQAELINKYDLNVVFGTDQSREEYVQDEPKDRQLADLRNFKKFFGSYRGLKMATGNAYELSKLTTYQNPYPDGKIGVLEDGSFADLLFVKGNPVQDLEILCDPDNVKLVMKGGKVYKDTRKDI